MLSARWPMAAGERVDRSLPLLGAGRPGFVAGVLWHSPDVALDSGKLGLVLFKEANQPKQYLGGSPFISCEISVFIMK